MVAKEMASNVSRRRARASEFSTMMRRL